MFPTLSENYPDDDEAVSPETCKIVASGSTTTARKISSDVAEPTGNDPPQIQYFLSDSVHYKDFNHVTV